MIRRRFVRRPLCLLLALYLLPALAGCAQLAPVRVDASGTPLATAEARPQQRPTPVPTVPGPPAPTPIAPIADLVPGRTIAFVSDRGGRIDLWLRDIDPVAPRLRRLTNDAAIEMFPIWSPDGTMLAYVVEDEHEVRNLWVLDLRIGRHRQLTREEPPFNVRRAVWLRGGRALLYDTGKLFDRRPELRVVTIEGSPLAPLVPAGDNVIFDWSSDGETVICAIAPPLGEPKIVVAEATPGTTLRPAAGDPVGFAVELSPDGRYATFSAPPLSDDQSAWLLEVATGRKWELNKEVKGRRYDHDFAWSPDGRLAYVHSWAGVMDGQGRLNHNPGSLPLPAETLTGLRIVEWRVVDGEQLVVTRQELTYGSADAAPQWSPDGRWIAYLSDAQEPNPAESDIWIISADPPFGEKYNLTGATEGRPSNGNNWSPAWLPLPREAARGG